MGPIGNPETSVRNYLCSCVKSQKSADVTFTNWHQLNAIVTCCSSQSNVTGVLLAKWQQVLPACYPVALLAWSAIPACCNSLHLLCIWRLGTPRRFILSPTRVDSAGLLAKCAASNNCGKTKCLQIWPCDEVWRTHIWTLVVLSLVMCVCRTGPKYAGEIFASVRCHQTMPNTYAATRVCTILDNTEWACGWLMSGDEADSKRSLNLGQEMFPSGATTTRLSDDTNVRTFADPSDMYSRTLLPLTMRFELKGRPP